MAKSKVLYLHGLDSSPMPEKVEIFREFGFEPIAPQLYYKENKNVIADIHQLIQKERPTWITGSSLGGYVAFWMGQHYKLPSLLFNPALAYHDADKNWEKTVKENRADKLIILGRMDEVVPAESTLQWLENNDMMAMTYIVHMHQLAHQIPIDIFRVGVDMAVTSLNI